MTINEALLSVLACPASQRPLHINRDTLINKEENSEYPLIDGIPWLLANPHHSLVDWSIKLNHFHQVLQSEIQQLQGELQIAHPVSQPRLNTLIKSKAAFLRSVFDLMSPVVRNPMAQKPVYDALTDTAPSTQNLLSYEANLYRDWVWGDEENRISLDIVSQHLHQHSPKKLLVLGGGASRLAYDLHQALKPALSCVTDINPLLLLAAKQIIKGEGLSIYEFPSEPRSSDYVAIEHQIKTATPADQFEFVFSDATKPAFIKGAFDTIVTPWLIDIQPFELSRFLQQLNQYMNEGQYWVNFGSLVFNQQRDALCYTVDEIKSIAKEQGFEIGDIVENTIPYLKSPYNAGHRVETVWSWQAVKTHDVAPLPKPEQQHRPDWLIDTALPIPKNDAFKHFSLNHRIYAQLTAEVDGRTSINRISAKFAKQQKLNPDEAKQLVTKLFGDIY